MFIPMICSFGTHGSTLKHERTCRNWFVLTGKPVAVVSCLGPTHNQQIYRRFSTHGLLGSCNNIISERSILVVDSSVGIAMSYELDGRGSIPCRDFSLLHSLQTGPGTHSFLYPMSTGASFLQGWSSQDLNLTTHLHLVPRLWMVELSLHFHTRFNGVMLN
jgi:hypothetical protein